MKRDMTLIHRILQAIEEHPGTGMTFDELDKKLSEGKLIPASINETIKRKERRNYHLALMMNKKLITVWARNIDPEVIEYQLTFEGHDYLEALTDPTPTLKSGDRVEVVLTPE